MSSNFFIRKSKHSSKRKHVESKSSIIKKNKIKVNEKVNGKVGLVDSEEISSDDESFKRNSDVESDENLVSAQEKKVLLAKKYLEEIEREEKDRLETGDIQSSVVNRLKEDLLDQAGKLKKQVADKLLKPENNDIFVLRCKEHKLSITCVAISSDNRHMYSASKDATIVKWALDERRKLGVIYSKHLEKDESRKNFCHSSPILSLAVSFNCKFLASSDESSVIRIWDTQSLNHVHSFTGHRSTVTGLAFCYETNNLYSCSKDRSVRIWNLDEMSFVETLFGHQCSVTDIDVLKKDRAVTSGGTDNTLRVWKVQEESQLIFNGHLKSIDRVKKLDQQHFISCGDDGQLCVWGILKKKPLCIIPEAHGVDDLNNEPNWISSICCIPNSDLIVSGANEGHLRFWKCEENFRNVLPLFSVPVMGFINSISFADNGNLIVVGVGQEHRLGRWYRESKAKNSVLIIHLKYSNSQEIKSKC